MVRSIPLCIEGVKLAHDRLCDIDLVFCYKKSILKKKHCSLIFSPGGSIRVEFNLIPLHTFMLFTEAFVGFDMQLCMRLNYTRGQGCGAV